MMSDHLDSIIEVEEEMVEDEEQAMATKTIRA